MGRDPSGDKTGLKALFVQVDLWGRLSLLRHQICRGTGSGGLLLGADQPLLVSSLSSDWTAVAIRAVPRGRCAELLVLWWAEG